MEVHMGAAVSQRCLVMCSTLMHVVYVFILTVLLDTFPTAYV